MRYVYRCIRKCSSPAISTVLSKLKDFSKSQAITYTVKVITSRKRCKIKTLSLQTTNRKFYISYRIAPFQMTLSDLQVQGLRLSQSFSNAIFVQLYRSWQDFDYEETLFGEPWTRRSVTSDIGRLRKTFTYLRTYLLMIAHRFPRARAQPLGAGSGGSDPQNLDWSPPFYSSCYRDFVSKCDSKLIMFRQ